MHCRLTGAPLEIVLDLGQQPLGNGFRTPGDPSEEYFFQLQCGFSEKSKLFQLVEQPSPELMFHGAYAFFSGTSRHMTEHFAEATQAFLDKGYMSGGDPFVVELGSNDGIFLSNFANRGIRHLGIEPSGGVADVAESRGISVLREFFDDNVAKSILAAHGSADLVFAANVMCHISDIRALASGISDLLAPDGVLVFEDPYLGDVIRLTSYDQIYDEHVFLFSALSVQAIFGTVGMELIDVEHQSTHGGSMRYTLAKTGARSVRDSVRALLEEEKAAGLGLVETFHDFARRVSASAAQLYAQLTEFRAAGKRIAAYGATSKSTTIYNYAGIGPELLDYICDNTPIKIGKVSPGQHIPVATESRFVESPPDIAFMAAWNHEVEIRRNNAGFEAAGGRWITHVPHVHILD